VIELGMPFTDPMADGPAIQAAGPARAQGRSDAQEDARNRARFSQGRRRDADHADGLLQSDLCLWRRRFLKDAIAAGRRRPDRRRSAARGRRRTLHSRAQGGARFIRLATPTTDDKRLPAVLQNVGLRLLRLDHRHHRLGDARQFEGRGAVARIKRHTRCPSRSASA
jgi:tryptophan synthase alpha chain